MKVIPTAAVHGAEIAGVDLSRPLDDATFAAIELACNEYGVLSAIEIPELHGFPLGDTEFASAAAAGTPCRTR
jgi:hypothetical protein